MHKTTRLTHRETAAWLCERDDFLILTHRRPDGDTLGCAAGLCAALREIGKRAYVLENPETTARYVEYVADYLAPADFSPQTIISVDTADCKILQGNAGAYASRVDLSIDHHASNTGYAAYTCLDGNASCGETVFDVLQALSGTISKASALPLYVAVSTDTGCFAYANVTPHTFSVAAALIAAGADHVSVNKKLFRTKTRARIALDGAIYSSLQYYHRDQIAVLVLTQELLTSCGVTEDDLDDVAAIPNQVEGVQIGIVVRELPTGGCKISVRTAPGVNANAICKHFGGGGHAMAAGCTIDETPEAAVGLLLGASEGMLR